MVKSLLLSFIIAFLPYGLSYATDARSISDDYRTANKLFASGQFQDALFLYQKLLGSLPEGVSVSEIHTRIGDTCFRLGLFQKALDAYRSSLDGREESLRPETQYWIAFCSFLLGRDSEAVKEFLKIPEIYPRSGIWVGTAYYWAGRACERMGKAEEAAGYYRKAGGKGRSTQERFAMKKAEAVKGTSTKHQAPNPK